MFSIVKYCLSGAGFEMDPHPFGPKEIDGLHVPSGKAYN